jgi:predicted RNase H-like nuclease (RuvC/YqgF family)
MAFQNGAEPRAERHAANSGLSQPSGADDVTITIRGATAARMLGRGDAENRIIEELGALNRRLDAMEETAARRAAQHEAVSQAFQALQEKVEQLSRQLALQSAELDRLRSDLDDQSFRTAPLSVRMDQLQGQIAPLIVQLGQMQAQIERLESAPAPKPAGNANGETSAPVGWRQRLNGLWFW